MNLQMPDDQQASLVIGADDEFGNPTASGLGTPVVSGFDPAIAAVTVGADNSLLIVPTGKLGSTQVLVAVPVGGTTINDQINLEVIAGTAVSLTFTPTFTPNPVPPAPATP